MLTSSLIHPQILEAIASCGYHDKILICSNKYPLKDDWLNTDIKIVNLALRPEIPTVIDVLTTLNTCLNFEKAEVENCSGKIQPEIHGEFRDILGFERLLELNDEQFYDTCQRKIKLVIVTGEIRCFSNILLTVDMTLKI